MTATQNAIDFIHIGLGKCASTTLQNYWSGSKNYNFYSALNIGQTAAKLCQVEGVQVPSLDLNVRRIPGVANVLSCEGLSWGYLNRLEKQGFLQEKQAFVARIMAKARCASRILLMIRDPVAWIKSAHAQSINEGGFRDLSTFVDEQRQFIEGVLNLEFLLTYWRSLGFDVTVLPLEMLSAEPERFWQSYESRLGVVRPSSIGGQVLNRSQENKSDKSKLCHHAKLNELFWVMETSLRGSEEYKRTFQKEHVNLLGSLENARKWGVRRFVNFGEVHRVEEKIYGLGEENISAFLNFSLDHDLFEFINNKFIQFVEKNTDIDEFYLDGYSNSLEDVLS